MELIQFMKKLLLKGFLGAGYKFPGKGTILVSLKDNDKEEGVGIVSDFIKHGFDITATKGTANILSKKDLI